MPMFCGRAAAMVAEGSGFVIVVGRYTGMCVCERECVCACVCERERERERRGV